MTWIEIIILVVFVGFLFILLLWWLDAMIAPGSYSAKVEPMCLDCGAYNYECDCDRNKWKDLNMDRIILGQEYKDEFTGVIGTAVARCTYLHDAPAIHLVLKLDKDGKMQKPVWINEQRLVPFVR